MKANKKILLIAYISIFVIVSAIVLNNIFAAGSSNKEGTTTYGGYVIKELPEDEGEHDKKGAYNSSNNIGARDASIEELDSFDYLFCTDESQNAATNDDMKDSETAYYLSNDGTYNKDKTYFKTWKDQNTKFFSNQPGGYYNSVIQQLYRTAKNSNRIGSSYISDTDGLFVSRKYQATESPKPETIDDPLINYILAVGDNANGNTIKAQNFVNGNANAFEYCTAQNALWYKIDDDFRGIIKGTNSSGSTDTDAAIKKRWEASKGEELYKEAEAYAGYIESLKNTEDPMTVSNVNDATTEFIGYKSGLKSAGPFKINYGSSGLTEEQKEIRDNFFQITEYHLYGNARDGKQVELVKGTKDSYANADWIFAKKKTENGQIKFSVIDDFPDSGEAFYIVATPNAYKKVKTINLFTVKCKVKEISDAQIYYIDNGVLNYQQWVVSSDGTSLEKGDSYAMPAQKMWLLWDVESYDKVYELDINFHEPTPTPDTGTPTPTPSNTPTPTPSNTPTPTPSNTPTPTPGTNTPTPTPHTNTPTPTPSNTPTPTPSNTPTPTPTPETNIFYTYVDIAGMVWIDKEELDNEHKSTISDSMYLGVADNEEYPRQNVFVQLFIRYEDGSEEQVYKGMEVKCEAADEFSELIGELGLDTTTIIDGGENTHLVDKEGNPTDMFETYTDADGRYVFYDLPIGPDYFVRFTYDGLNYEPVEYLAGAEEGVIGHSVEGQYLWNPNKFKLEEASKVKDEIDREEFNSQFETITGFSDVSSQNRLDQKETKGMFYNLQTSNNGTQMRYRTDDFGGQGVLESRVLTTWEIYKQRIDYSDVENNTRQDGIAGEEYEISADTKLTFPIYRNGKLRMYRVNPEVEEEGRLAYMKHINLGLKRRVHADLRLSVTANAGAITIKNQEKVIQYKDYGFVPPMDSSDMQEEYIKQEISAADYNWRDNFIQIYEGDGNYTVSQTSTNDGETANQLSKDGTVIFDSFENQLKVYVLYSIKLINESSLSTDIGRINQIIDYYDENLELVENRDEIQRVYELFKNNATDQTAAGTDITNTSVTATWPTYDPNNPWSTASWIVGKDINAGEVKWDKGAANASTNTINGYNVIRATFDGSQNSNVYLSTSNSGTEIPTIYLVLKVKNNGNVLNITGAANEDGMANIAEIASYSILNENHNPAGKVDEDSAPLNAIPGNRATYEDDADDGALFKIEVNNTPRTIEGTVWDDANSNGTMDDADKVEGVKVELIEWLSEDEYIVRPGWTVKNDTLGVNRTDEAGNPIETRTDNNGQYSFWVEGGNYQIKFTYGDEYMLKGSVEDSFSGNAKYNAQDYRATNNKAEGSKGYTPLSEIYPGKAFFSFKQIPEDEVKLLDGAGHDVDNGAGNIINWNAIFESLETDVSNTSQKDMDSIGFNIEDSNKLKSSARDDADIRATRMINALRLTNKEATLLDLLPTDKEKPVTDTSRISELLEYTEMESKSDIIVMTANDLADKSTIVNLGLQEREKASVSMDKVVERIVLKASDGTTLIDTSDNTKLQNLQQLQGIQETFINLDAALMDGATIDFYYNINVANDAAENDKLDNYVYVENEYQNDYEILKGKLEEEEIFKKLFTKADESYSFPGKDDPLPIRINTIYDYVNINLEYRAVDNLSDDTNTESVRWTKIYENGDDKVEGGIQSMVGYSVDDFLPRAKGKVSKVLETSDNAENRTKSLIASENDEEKSANIPVRLGITLAENMQGLDIDTIFSNCAEIVEIYSGAGRRDYETVAGDYEPYSNSESEDDADLTGSTAVTPPLGSGENVHYYVIAIVSVTIVIGGIIFIKKKFFNE